MVRALQMWSESRKLDRNTVAAALLMQDLTNLEGWVNRLIQSFPFGLSGGGWNPNNLSGKYKDILRAAEEFRLLSGAKLGAEFMLIPQTNVKIRSP